MKKEIIMIIIAFITFVLGFGLGIYFNQNFEITAKQAPLGNKDGVKLPSYYSKKLISYEKAMKDDKPAMVFFYVDWCGYCKRFAPLVPELTKKYKGKLNIVMVNCEDASNGSILQNYEINGYPSVYLVNPKKGESEYIDASNYYPITSISAYLDNYLNK